MGGIGIGPCPAGEWLRPQWACHPLVFSAEKTAFPKRTAPQAAVRTALPSGFAQQIEKGERSQRGELARIRDLPHLFQSDCRAYYEITQHTPQVFCFSFDSKEKRLPLLRFSPQLLLALHHLIHAGNILSDVAYVERALDITLALK